MTAPIKKPIAAVLEDSSADAKLIAAFLDRFGFEYAMTGVAEKFLAECARLDPSLCIVDLNLARPGEGFSVIRDLRARKTAAIVVVVSGVNKLESVRRALAAGAHDYFMKPFDFSNVAMRLSRYFTEFRVAVGGRDLALPPVPIPVVGKVAFRVQLDALDEEFLSFRTRHLILKGTEIKIHSDKLGALLGSGPDPSFVVLSAKPDAKKSGYLVTARWSQYEPDQAPRIRANILREKNEDRD